MVRVPFARLLGLALLTAASLFAAGCEEDVTDLHISGTPFTIYGVVNPTADTQYVRVFPVTDTPAAHSPDPIQASARYVDLESGTVYSARDSVVAFQEGRFGHVFWAAFRPRFDASYRIEVESGDGVTSYATVRTPPPSAISELQPYTRFEPQARDRVPMVPLMVERTDGVLQQIVAVYHVEAHNIGRDFHVIPYDTAVQDVAGGWRVDVDLVRDYNAIYAIWQDEYRRHEADLRERGVECCRVEFYGLELRAVVVDSNWVPPGGVYDPELLVQPGTMDNVENGFGFIGAGYEARSDVFVPRCLQYWAGYVFADNPCTGADYCTYRGEC
ncbi:MAG TPA: hypothetical protein VF190_04345 [Rhodothermales bacterium]